MDAAADRLRPVRAVPGHLGQEALRGADAADAAGHGRRARLAGQLGFPGLSPSMERRRKGLDGRLPGRPGTAEPVLVSAGGGRGAGLAGGVGWGKVAGVG